MGAVTCCGSGYMILDFTAFGVLLAPAARVLKEEQTPE
jgi:hypothetical protein